MERELTLEDVLEQFGYDSNKGVLTWNVNRAGVTFGAVAGWTQRENRNTYRRVELFGKKYYAHVLIWLIGTGSWPPPGMDVAHDDQNGLNNLIGNLYLTTTRENQMNIRRPTSNTSGTLGVSWHKGNKKWEARIKVRGKSIFLGYFVDVDDAIAARAAGSRKYGFHPLHGSG